MSKNKQNLLQDAEIVAVITPTKEERQLVQTIFNFVELAGIKNHFKSVCLQAAKINKQQMQPKQRAHLSKTRQRKTFYVADDEEISESSDDNSYEIFTLSVNNMASNRTTQPMFKVNLLETSLTLMADSGARINILDERDFNKPSP